MKEIDRANFKEDITHIRELLEGEVDCEDLVLIHFKEALIPHHFTEADLRERGAILTLEDLNAAIQRYNQIGVSGKPIDTYRIDHYMKRLYLSSKEALKMWQHGKFANQEVDTIWNLEATSYLASKWVKSELPTFLQEYTQKAEENYTANKYLLWDSEALDDAEAKALDKVILKALGTHWHLAVEEIDPVSIQIRNNIIDEALKLCQTNADPSFAKEVLEFIRGKVLDQLNSHDLDKESIQKALEDEKSRLLKGMSILDHRPYYNEATAALLDKWQKGDLEKPAYEDVSAYIKKWLRSYPLSGHMKSILLNKAIPQLLYQYRNNELSDELMERLTVQFKTNINGHYEKLASKDTPYREELSQVIFTQLLMDWKAQKLSTEASQYLQTHLLLDLQKSLQEFGLPTSRFTLYLIVNRQQEEIASLRDEMASLRQEMVELRGQKPTLSTGKNDNNTSKSDAALAEAQGMFRTAPSASNPSTPDGNFHPKLDLK